jgi:hypothetical protein
VLREVLAWQILLAFSYYAVRVDEILQVCVMYSRLRKGGKKMITSYSCNVIECDMAMMCQCNQGPGQFPTMALLLGRFCFKSL